MNIRPNTFCWHGIATDLEAAPSFYRHVLGWQLTDDSDSGPMFVAPGGAVAHMQPVEDGPPAWCSYLSVDDVDASTARATATGGTTLVPPTDLPVGRFSVVTTPSGAVFGLYQAAEQDELAQPGPGTVHWVELHSTEEATDLAWLRDVFGFEDRVQPMAMGPYHVLEAGGQSRGGVTTARNGVSHFLAWVEVEALDGALEQVHAQGGKVVSEPFAAPDIGRMAVVADPAGAMFGLIQPV